MKVILLTRYGRAGASSRLRMLQYLPYLEKCGIEVEVSNFISDRMLLSKYQKGRYSNTDLLKAYLKRTYRMLNMSQYDLVWLEKEALPWVPVFFEALLLKSSRFVIDFDDAIFHNYDKNSNFLVRRVYGRRIDHLMFRSSLVVCGNSYLADRAREAGSVHIEIIPTVIDVGLYPAVEEPANKFISELPRVVWIGSPSTVQYLKMLSDALRALSKRVPYILRVIGARLEIEGVRVELVPWEESTEVKSISECDIGIMPLTDSWWERGKCGYKLVQYMGCSIPVVASPIGVNRDLVVHGQNGFLASTHEEWICALEKLLLSQKLRTNMGLVGRQLVQSKYSLEVTAPRMAKLLLDSANRS